MELIEKGTTRRHTFFSINKEQHTAQPNFIEAHPKEIQVFSRLVKGWLITTAEPAIDTIIRLEESLDSELALHDPE